MEEPNLSSMTHLGTKSSVFQPTQLGAGGQQEIFRHMKRHYDRLDRVTAVTDTTPPRALTKSTLARDRKQKHPLVDNFKIPVTSKLLQEQFVKTEPPRDLISLPTNDSDVQSILRRIPELESTIKFKHGTADNVNLVTEDKIGNNKDYYNQNEYRHTEEKMNISRKTFKNAAFNDHDMEARYLQFVSDITKDVLASSISSDRALNMLFERHIAHNKTSLNETIMRGRVRELKVKLNIKS